MEKNYRSEIEKIQSNTIFSKKFKRKKTVIWFIRTIIAAVLYYYLWEHQWVRWTLTLYIPLNLFGLFIIYQGSYFLNKKAERLKNNNEF